MRYLILRHRRQHGRDFVVFRGITLTEKISADPFGLLNKRNLNCSSASNRNFPWPPGKEESKVLLASPYTVAATALAARILDPREYL